MSLASYVDAWDSLGTLQTIHYAFQRFRNRVAPSPALLNVRSRYAKHTLACRPGTSDIEVFGQVFVHREYRCLDHVDSSTVRLVIDCGANVGFSAAYFLSRFPKAQLVAVEPDRGNFLRLMQHLNPYGDRARAVLGGIWWRECGLMVTRTAFGDGREWSFGVREATGSEVPDVEAFDIDTLLRGTGERRISILKVDIEGSELELFRHPCSWLQQVDHIVIETHGVDCEAAARSACEEHGITLRRFNDELMVGARAELPRADSTG